MAHLIVDDENLIIAVCTKILIINESTSTILNVFDLPISTKTDKNQNDDGDEDIDGQKNTEQPEPNVNQIQQICLSPNRELLAFSTSKDKLLYLYRCNYAKGSLDLLSKRDISRTTSAIRFSPDSNDLLVADKSGDCYLYDCVDSTKPAKWLLAHLSMVLDVMFTNDKRFIITCDRDEKIRLTNYPETHLIEAYGLGHTEYVSSICFLPTHPQAILLSVSGDKTIKLWNLLSGCHEFCDFEIEAAGHKIALKKHNNSNHLALTFVDMSQVSVYEIKKTKSFEIKKISEHQFNDLKTITSISFDRNGSLVLIGLTENDKILLHKLNASENGEYTAECWNVINEIISKELNDFQFVLPEDLSMLFKKKFDNVESYQERKRRRIEEKNKRL